MRRPLILLLALCASCSSNSPTDRERIARTPSPIIGGVTDNDAQAHESVVFLMLGYMGGCTGSLIAPNLVLTARHCVSHSVLPEGTGIDCDPYGNSSQSAHVGANLAPSDIAVYTGFAPNMWGSPAAVGKQIIVNEQSKLLCANDVGLVVLDQPIAGATPMKLRLSYSAQIGEKVMAIGYGLTNPNNQNSAGQRFRRGDIPVVTAGMDYNFWNGAGEFVLGQSTCQGDSGGPITAMATGAILGVTSRGGDCKTGYQTFIMIDKHKDLIDKALLAAGATAVDEGVTPPTPVGKKKTGEKPCAVGAECKGLYCMDKSYCSEFCNPGQCPSDMICLDTKITIMGMQQPDPVPMCVPLPTTGTACEVCRYDTCKDYYEMCAAEPACMSLLKCVDACTSSACREGCKSKNASGVETFAYVYDCMCTTSCTPKCTGQCGDVPEDAGVGGAGGAAGAGGSGGGQAGASEGGAAGEAGTGGTDPGLAEQPASGSSGGCTTSKGSSSGLFGLLFGAAALVAARRRRRSP
ncbi:MAG: S1 family peptidase [Deltaproteobacteria bacterium]|nr:S1 family peptidase [Deltaproteobacteria bacterium]